MLIEILIKKLKSFYKEINIFLTNLDVQMCQFTVILISNAAIKRESILEISYKYKIK